MRAKIDAINSVHAYVVEQGEINGQERQRAAYLSALPLPQQVHEGIVQASGLDSLGRPDARLTARRSIGM